MALKLDAYNTRVEEWDRNTDVAIKTNATRHNVVHRPDSPSKGSSVAKFRGKTFKEDGAINKITKTFPRNLIWTHKGAGKGRGGRVGSRWVDLYGAKKSTNPKSFGKMGGSGRVAKEFINEILDGPNGVEELATIAAEEIGSAITGSLFIK